MSSDFAIKASPSGSKSEYVYLQKSGPICYNEESLKDVYNLKVDYLSLGILLDSGVIPTPHSPYKDFYVLNAGDDLVVNSTNGSVITSSNFHYTRTDSAKK